jgi:tol-pal system protein YbgF
MLSGCASTGDVESLRDDVEMQRSNDRKEVAQLKSSVDELTRNYMLLKEQGVASLREGLSSLLTQVGDLSKEIQVLEGRFDEYKYSNDKTMKDLQGEKDLQQARISAIENDLKDIKNDIKDIKTKISPAQPTAAAEGPSQTGQTPSPAEGQTPSASDYAVPQKLYDDAQIDFKEKHYEEARRKFEKITTDFTGFNLAPNAYFWIGETYYMQKKYDDAILAYENFLKKYPSHDKARAAMLKQAYAFIAIGDKKTGKVILERVIEKYPRSAEAKLAEKKIAEILHTNSKKTRKKKKQP